MCTHNLSFDQKHESSKKTMQLKIVIFTAVKNGCILHGCVYIWVLCKMNVLDYTGTLL